MPNRRKSGKSIRASTHRVKEKSNTPSNAFEITGSPISGLISPEELEIVFTSETLNNLADQAKILAGNRPIARRPIDCREWFKGQILSLSREFLEDARAPGVRSIRNELLHLANILEVAICRSKNVIYHCTRDLDHTISHISDHTPPCCNDIADYVLQLTPQALDQISRYGTIELPSTEDLRRGDYEALSRLRGLVPVQPDEKSETKESIYIGVGRHELTKVGRPMDARIEQFAMMLCAAYALATGKPAGRSERSPFITFSMALMGCLCRSDAKDTGIEAFKRAAKKYKALILKRK